MDRDEPVAGRVLISYAHESSEHVAAVRRFHTLLREHGLDVVIDAGADRDRQDWALWTTQQMAAAERVLVVASPRYKARFEASAPIDEGRGVRFEGLLIREEILRDMSAGLRRFVPVLLPGRSIDEIPWVLQPYSATHYRVAELTAEGVQHVVRLLRHDPRTDSSPTTGRDGTDGPVAALRLAVRGDTPTPEDAAVREFLAMAGSTGGVEVDDVAVGRGATVEISPQNVVSALSRISRCLRDLLGRHATPPGGGLELTVGGHVAETGDAALTEVNRLTDADAVRRMHSVPGAGLVLVASGELHELISASRTASPAPQAYRSCPSDGISGRPTWIAVPGRTVCPELPPAVPVHRASDEPSRADGAGERPVGALADGNVVINHGVVGNGVVNHGTGHVVNAGRDATVTFGSGS